MLKIILQHLAFGIQGFNDGWRRQFAEHPRKNSKNIHISLQVITRNDLPCGKKGANSINVIFWAELKEEPKKYGENHGILHQNPCILQLSLVSRGELKSPEIHHALGFHAPHFQAEAAEDFQGMQRSRPGLAQLRNGPINFRQTIKRNPVIEMMNVVVANIAREPRHRRVRFQKAGGFERRPLIGPALFVLENDPGKIVLRIKKI